MASKIIKRITVLGCIFAVGFGQNSQQLPDNLYVNMAFVVAVPQGEFSNNVTKTMAMELILTVAGIYLTDL